MLSLPSIDASRKENFMTAALSPRRRKQIAKKAAAARWGKAAK